MTTLPEKDLDDTVQHLGGLWKELRGARLFLTGGTGFFGTWLLESAARANRELKLGLEVHVLTRQRGAFAVRAPHLASADWLHLIEGDVRSFPFPSGPFTHVIHAATPTHAAAYDETPEMMLDVIVQGMRRVLDFARSSGVRRFLFTSSGAVYGPQPPELPNMDEDYAGAPDPLDVRSVYAQGKRLAEHLAALYLHQFRLPVSIARGFAFVGPLLPLDAHFAVGNFIRDGLRGGPIRVNGDGTPYRSYLHAADLTTWLWTILLRGTPCRPYNVGSDQALSIAELARKVADHFHTEVRISGKPVAGARPARYVPCTARAQSELGLRRRIDLDEALERTIRWHRSREAQT